MDAYKTAHSTSEQVRAYTTKPEDIDTYFTEFYLSADQLSGFCVTYFGELHGVFSLEKGRGDDLMFSAKYYGASSLDCFDGYLTKFYSKHGFKETRREPNWVAGEPDVVYMGLDY